MTDGRPERVYGIVVREGQVFLMEREGGLGLPGGIFRPMADDRKVELAGHLYDQMSIRPTRTWAQGAFDYRDAAETTSAFSGFYSVWAWEGEVRDDMGRWYSKDDVMSADLSPSLRILLVSVLETLAVKTR